MKNFFLIFFLFTVSLFSFELEKVSEIKLQAIPDHEVSIAIEKYDNYFFVIQELKNSTEKPVGEGLVIYVGFDDDEIPKKKELTVHNLKGEYLFSVGKPNSYEMGGTSSPFVVGFSDNILEVCDFDIKRYYFFKIDGFTAKLEKTVLLNNNTINKIIGNKYYKFGLNNGFIGHRGNLIKYPDNDAYYKLGKEQHHFYPVKHHRELVNLPMNNFKDDKYSYMKPDIKENIYTGHAYGSGLPIFNRDNSYYVMNFLGIDIYKYNSDDEQVAYSGIPSMYKIQKDFFDNYEWDEYLKFNSICKASGLYYDEYNDKLLVMIALAGGRLNGWDKKVKYFVLNGTTLKKESEMFDLGVIPITFDEDGKLWTKKKVDDEIIVESYEVRY